MLAVDVAPYISLDDVWMYSYITGSTVSMLQGQTIRELEASDQAVILAPPSQSGIS